MFLSRTMISTSTKVPRSAYPVVNYAPCEDLACGNYTPSPLMSYLRACESLYAP